MCVCVTHLLARPLAQVAMRTVGLEIPDRELTKLLAAVDKDGSGEFEFVEFVEVVKLLLVRMREATEAQVTSLPSLLQALPRDDVCKGCRCPMSSESLYSSSRRARTRRCRS